MKLKVQHLTRYAYTGFASQSHNHVCLQPRNTTLQTCISSQVRITPEPDNLQQTTDVYGNTSTRFSLSQPHQECSIDVTSLIETTDQLAALPASAGRSDNLLKLKTLQSNDSLMANDCLLPTLFIPLSTVLDAFIAEIPVGEQPVLNYANQLMQHIYKTFEYEAGFSTLVTPLKEIYAARKGVCQDFAHLAIAVLRRQGIPARYVSGYLETLPPPGEKKLQGADASHAWFSVFDATNGWYDFDPTNNKRPDKQYVTTAWGRDYADVTPIKGVVYGGGKHTLTVEVDVNRLSETWPQT